MYKHDMKTALSHERAYKVHRERVRNVRGFVDCGPPFHNPHVYMNLKKMEYDERKNLEIDKANKNLLSRLQKVLETDVLQLTKHKMQHKGPTTMDSHTRLQRQKKIQRDNIAIAYRIQNMKPYYKASKWEDEYKQMKYLQGIWTNNSSLNNQFAIYNPTPRTHRSTMSLSLNSTRESKDGKQDEKLKELVEEESYEDDFEDENETKEKEKKKESKPTKLPSISKPKKTEKNENGTETRKSKAQEKGRAAKAEFQERKSAYSSPYTDFAQQ